MITYTSLITPRTRGVVCMPTAKYGWALSGDFEVLTRSNGETGHSTTSVGLKRHTDKGQARSHREGAAWT